MTDVVIVAAARAGTETGSLELADTMIEDGLWDAFDGGHRATTPEILPRLRRASAAARASRSASSGAGTASFLIHSSHQ